MDFTPILTAVDDVIKTGLKDFYDEYRHYKAFYDQVMACPIVSAEIDRRAASAGSPAPVDDTLTRLQKRIAELEQELSLVTDCSEENNDNNNDNKGDNMAKATTEAKEYIGLLIAESFANIIAKADDDDVSSIVADTESVNGDDVAEEEAAESEPEEEAEEEEEEEAEYEAFVIKGKNYATLDMTDGDFYVMADDGEVDDANPAGCFVNGKAKFGNPTEIRTKNAAATKK